jgi:hypothetical protein
MLTIIGATLVAGTSAGFWYLLPRNGEEHPLVQNPGVGSMAKACSASGRAPAPSVPD